MRRAFRCLLFAGLLSAPDLAGAAPRGFATGPPGAWVRTGRLAPGLVTTERAESGILFEFVDMQVNLAVSPPQYFFRLRMRVLNEAGLADASLQTMSFDPSFETLTIHDVNIERDGAVIRAFDPGRVRVLRRETDLEQQVFDGGHTAVVTLDDVRVGDVLDYAYTRTGVNPALSRDPAVMMLMGFSHPVARLQRRVLWPADRPAQVRLRHIAAEPALTRADGVVEYLWSLGDVPALEPDGDLPDGYETLPLAQVTAYPDWQSLARWGAALYPSTGPVPAAVRAVADTIARRASGAGPRTLLALQIVQEEVRYLAEHLGEGAYRPRPADVVLRRRYGDCKDKVALLLELLRALGVRAEPALVSTRTGRQVDAFAPAPQVFDHVIACVTLDGRRHWLDPTRLGQRGSRLEQRSAADGGWALVLSPETRSLARMDPPPESRAETFVWKHFDSPGYTDTVRLGVVTEYRGAAAERTRRWLREQSVSNRTESCLRFYRGHYERILETRDIETFDVADSNVVRVVESYVIPGFWTPDSATGRYTALLSPIEIASSLPPEPDPDRTAPLGLGLPSLARCETWLTAPEEAGIRESDAELRSPFVRVRVRESSEGRTVHLLHEIETLAPLVPAESLAAFAAFAAPVPGRLEFTLQSSIGRAGRPANAGLNLPLLFILLACLAACVLLVVRGSRAQPPQWWTRRALAFSDEPAASGGVVTNADAAADAAAVAAAVAAPTAEPAPSHGGEWAGDAGTPEEPAATAPPEAPRIGGWLLLPAFGLVVSPFRVAYEARTLPSLLDQSIWNATVEAAGPERAAMQFLLLFELCGNLLLIALFVWAILELFRRRRIFPLAYIIAMGTSVVITLLDLVLGRSAGPLTAPEMNDLGALGRSLAGFAIWSAYMLQSKRVRRTFVH